MNRHLITALAVLGLVLSANLSPAQTTEKEKPHKPTPKKSTGTTPKAFLGITVGQPAEEEQQGVTVQQVMPQSPAAEAGMKKGDVIQRVEKRRVESYDELLSALSSYKAGDEVAFDVQRDGQTKHLTVTLGRRPTDAARGRAGQPGESRPERPAAYLGVRAMPVEEFPERLRERFGLEDEHGAVVVGVAPRSPADKAGLRHGDVITRIDGQDVKTMEDLRGAVRQAGVGQEVSVQVVRDGAKKELHARLEEPPIEGLNLNPFRPGFLGAEESAAPGYSASMEEMRREIRTLQRQVELLQERIRQMEKKSGAKPQD
jgi:S1-C subfamily serine protease